MFSITDHKGVRITFENGWSVSIQWGPGNYCDHHSASFGSQRAHHLDLWESKTAQTAVIAPDGSFFEIDGDSVQGYQTPAQVAALIALVAAK